MENDLLAIKAENKELVEYSRKQKTFWFNQFIIFYDEIS